MYLEYKFLNMSINNNEISLVDLFKSLYSFVSRYKLVLIIGLLLGLSFGYYTSSQKVKKSRNIYRTHILVNSPFLDKDEVFMIASSFYYEEGSLTSSLPDEGLSKIITKIEYAKKYTMASDNPDISITFNTTEPSEISELVLFIKNKFKKNELFLSKYKIEQQNHKELTSIIDNQIKELEGEINTEHKLLYVSLIEKKQALAKKLILINAPILCTPIEPLNRLDPAVEFSYFEVIASGIILLLFFTLCTKIVEFIRYSLNK